MITPIQKSKIEQVINVFETSSPEGKYDALVKFKDYEDPTTKSRITQITFGRSQVTEFGNLKSLINAYNEHNGQYASFLNQYINKIGKQPSLSTDQAFCDALKRAGKTDPVMRTCQDELFDSLYYLPALGWFKEMGFTLPLSLLVIYDSIIHSGSIMTFLRQRFSEKAPIKGGNEKIWIEQYVDVRNSWLANHSNEILRNTVYRTACLKQQIKNNNWDLSMPVTTQGHTIA